MAKRKWCVWLLLGLLSGCAPAVAVLGRGHVEQAAHRQCEQMPSMEQRNQCLQAYDTTAPKDMRPRAPMVFSAPPTEASAELERQRRDALCIRREGQPPLCPN